MEVLKRLAKQIELRLPFPKYVPLSVYSSRALCRVTYMGNLFNRMAKLEPDEALEEAMRCLRKEGFRNPLAPTRQEVAQVRLY